MGCIYYPQMSQIDTDFKLIIDLPLRLRLRANLTLHKNRIRSVYLRKSVTSRRSRDCGGKDKNN